jgi:MYXO-CTERM domain-containing protein
MKISLAVLSTLSLVLFASTSSAAIVKYKATINGAQEVPAVDSASTGTADLDFDDVTNTLRGTIEFTLAEGTEFSAAHIHMAKCGTSGSIYKGLTEPGMNGLISIDPPIQLDEGGVKALAEGGLYINYHSKKNPGGEIRGQIYPEASTETCPPTAPAADGGAPPGSSSSGGTPTGGGDDAGAAAPAAAPAEDDGGCSTTGRSPGSGNGVLAAAALAVAGAVLGSRRRRAG